MNFYKEIKLLPDPEFTPPLLMNALFNKLHRGLVQMDTRQVGISFPAVDQGSTSLGKLLRIHGSRNDLNQLMGCDWLAGMRDHAVISDVCSTPLGSDFRVVRRVQAKSSPERLRRRLAKRRGISLAEAQSLIPDNVVSSLNLPFVKIQSKSTGQGFRLFIEHCPLQAAPVRGEFSGYGLSPTATIPWF